MATTGGAGSGPAGAKPGGSSLSGILQTVEDPSLPQITDFKADTFCSGERVDLSWGAPPSVVVFEYRIKRSRTTYALFVDDDTELIATLSPTAVGFSDTNLDENTVYYYTVFYTEDGVSYFVSDFSRAAGVSITDFEALEGTHWLYDLNLANDIRRRDGVPGPNQFVLRRYFDVLQCGIQLYRGLLDTWNTLTDWGATVAGRVGTADNQYSIIEGRLSDLGFPAQRALGIDTMRRVALGLSNVRRDKGSCTGLEKFTKLLTTWESECVVVGEGLCNGGPILRTWDGTSTIVRSQGGASDIDNSVGQLTDNSGTTFTAELFRNGVLVDALGNYECIEDNDETSFTLEDPTKQLVFERLYTLASGVLTDTTNRLIHDQSLRDLELKDSAGDVVTITSNLNGGGLDVIDNTTTVVLSGAVVDGQVSVAATFLNEPLTFANRDPEMQYLAYSGEHYWYFNARFDEDERGGIEDPWDVLFGAIGGAGLSFIPGPTDVILWVAEGFAQDVGTIDSLTATVMADADATWVPNELVGMSLNPNRGQNKLFKIVSNSTTTITVEAGSDMTLVANVGSSYVVLDALDARRYEALIATIGFFLPNQVKAFIYFL